ncbi:MAG: hypothetical protein OXF41_21740 [bacterium]|nr:hypothetical protein [bacterium]
MPTVIGCGALDTNTPELVDQSREMLSRVLTAIEELESWVFCPLANVFLLTGGDSHRCRGAGTGRTGWPFVCASAAQERRMSGAATAAAVPGTS